MTVNNASSKTKNSTAKKPADKHWADVSEAGLSLGIWFLVVVYRISGRVIFNIFLLPVMLYFFLFRKNSRLSSLEYLRRINNTKSHQSKEGLYWQSFKHFWQFGQSLIDKFAVWMGDIQYKHLVLHNTDIIDRQLDSGKGAVLLLSHLGNFEVCRSLSSSARELKLTVLMHTQHAEKFNSILSKYTKSSTVEILEVTEITPATAMILSEKIEQGGFVAITGDRVSVQNSDNCVAIDFLGEKANFPLGPYAIASIFKAPIISIFCIKNRSKYHVYFDTLSECASAPRSKRNEYFQSLAKGYAASLERLCLEHPLQWFNFFDFWKNNRK